MSSSETQGQSVGSGDYRRDESFQVRALLTATENFRPTFYPDPTDCLWVSEDRFMSKVLKNRARKGLFSRGAPELDPNRRLNSFIKAVIPVS